MTATTTPNNPLRQLEAQGQSVWLDNLTRHLHQSGELARLVEQDGLAGLTSNPSIFHKAMTGSDDYRASIHKLAQAGLPAQAIYETLAIEDIQAAADILRPVFTRTDGSDGFVSLEVSPHLGRDSEGSLHEARRLFRAVDRPNLLIKIPGTPEGTAAIEACLTEGISVNITLLFSREAHHQVMEAYLRALELRLARGLPLNSVASVASFFVSRIDVMVDQQLDALVKAGPHAEEARALRGKAAIANAKLAYQGWKEFFADLRWERLQRAGARVQRPLWASTSTKDPSYRDVVYVESLIGPHTVNTMPAETLEAFRDHGRVAATLEQGVDEATDVLQRLARLGIDVEALGVKLVAEGFSKFIEPFDALLKTIEEEKKAAIK